MAPGTSVGIDYEQQIKSNCRFYLGDGADLRIITSIDTREPTCWKVYVLDNDHGDQTCVLSAKGHELPQVYAKLHEASARAVQRYIKANGFCNAEHVGGKNSWKNKSKSGGGKKNNSPVRSDFVESCSSSDDEDNMSDGSASTTSSRSIISTKSPGPVFTPPTSTDSTIPPPTRIVTQQCSMPMMNPVPPPNVVPPPGWTPPGWTPSGRSMQPHAPPPQAPMARPQQQQQQQQQQPPALMRPPPLCYPNAMVYPVIFTLKSKVYGELVVLDKCILDYALILTRVCDILAHRFLEFPTPPSVMPSKNKISKMLMQIESVTLNGKKFVIGSKMRDLSALPLGPVLKRLSIVVSFEKAQFIDD